MTFREIYNQARQELHKELQLSSIEAVPRLVKVSINIGAGVAVSDGNFIAKVMGELAQITGQKPVITKAHKSIAGFKLREGAPIGVKVTLRGQRMFDFLDKLVNVSLPRVRDFQGIPQDSFDGHGNYTLGLKEHIVFPEITLDNIEKTFGLAVTIHTTAPTDELAKRLLTKLHFPFKE
ncbi:TPA: 50S ribosomal protein L5 [Patescibacteria group bacterium]|uniref:Large ribosomal subunit protein uL5 n=1 Tax=candidate division Kazan bacterium GW2011_GWA1_44_22 TaxID=1620410 RepID=A0A0G1I147_UNCK3|nr:MAG: 50S ribosomal protein L5 [candidate division Kazan bacterium GW2011_GWA1_44_22]HAR55031.1 50S ribosomal protein L5 [Patescibacteria group bacterium]HCR41909.1 50S ribosomal protein L5 [Patescibacteria group bacterium]